ncbi:hypothetical protein ACROYT_G030180 [Oculina patagonica]
MTPSTVCFGAKKDSYGSFRILTSGNIITFKLTYLSGSVSCNHKLPEFECNWGCKYSKLTSYTMGTLITDSDRNHLLPSEGYLSKEPGCGYYSLPWATPDSPLLVFDNFSTPLPVATNQEFQVWYNEDLYNCGEENNDGKTCAEVHEWDRELYFPDYYFYAERRLVNHTIQTLRVKSLDDCEYLCYLNDACVSLNIKNKDAASGTHECELNNSTHMEHDGDLKSDTVYYYRGAKNACGKKLPLCLNNATCQSGFTYKGYRCLCTPGFKGEHCEKDINECASTPCLNGGTCVDQINGYVCNCQAGYTGVHCENKKWIKMTPSAVCFGAKDDSYGSFKIPRSGCVITFKLTYLNGSVSCLDHANPRYKIKSKWGCEHSAVSNHPMGTHITDSSRNRLLPKNEYLKGGSDCLKIYYSLPWARPNSPELLFDNFTTPLAVSTGQEFQIWFSEDFNQCGDTDNGEEKTCAEVRGLYV